MTKPSKGTGTKARGKQGRAKANAARRQLMGMCEKVEVLLLAMSGLAGSLVAYELKATADRLNATVVAG